MSQTFVSILPYKKGLALIEAQNEKEFVTIICKTNHVIIRLVLIQFKLWLKAHKNLISDALFTPGNLEKIRQSNKSV